MKAMRRHDRALPQEIAEKMLEQNTYGVLSLVLPDGSPYGVPINYGYVAGEIIMHAALVGQKMDALKHMDQACFTVVHSSEVDKPGLTTHYASVMAFGKVKLVEDLAEKRAYLIKMLAHYDITETMALEDLDKTTGRTAVMVMTIEHLTAKGHPEAVKP